ncbi:MAG: ParA family protein [Lachnospiraceae bacterium]|nr:ParA family protein [Lachnospiraceae bacterium]MBQ9632515.1 ParA family protein [Lachnospiraceae bacterium]
MVTICFANNKGGSGKSTSCSNLGSALAKLGKKVLLIDGDMQMNLSLSFFDEEKVLAFAQEEQNIYRALLEEEDLTSYIKHTDDENIDIVVSTTLMSSIEMDLFSKWQREFVFRKCLKKIKKKAEYDFILIDSPPTLGCWVMNILCASDYVIMPVEASPWGLFGLANMFDFLDKVNEIAPDVSLLGILVTKVDERKNYYKQTMETLHSYENLPVFDTVIHTDSAIEWAQDASSTVVNFKRSSRSAKEYLKLAKEVDGKCQ